jgi:hypothetical protein
MMVPGRFFAVLKKHQRILGVSGRKVARRDRRVVPMGVIRKHGVLQGKDVSTALHSCKQEDVDLMRRGSSVERLRWKIAVAKGCDRFHHFNGSGGRPHTRLRATSMAAKTAQGIKLRFCLRRER